MVWTGIEKGRGKVLVSSNGLPKSVGMDDGKDSNAEMCMGVCVCVYAPVNEKGIKGKIKLEKF